MTGMIEIGRVLNNRTLSIAYEIYNDLYFK